MERIGINVSLSLGQIVRFTKQMNDHWKHGEYFWFGEQIGELAVFVTQDSDEYWEDTTVGL